MHKLITLTVALFMTCSFALPASAAEVVWSGATSAAWQEPTNWVGGVAPSLADYSMFQDGGSGNTVIDLGADLVVKSLQFKEALVGAYTIGTGGAGGQTLILNDLGNVTLQASNGQAQVVNADLVLGQNNGESTYWFANDSGSMLTIAGDVTGSSVATTAGVKTLSFYGAGPITTSGIISDGGAANVKVGMQGDGVFTMTGANTYTGGTDLYYGTLNFADGALGTTGTIDFKGNATLQWAVANTQDLSSRMKIEDGFAATIDVQSNDVVFASALQTGDLGTGGLTKKGDGALTLSAVNTYTGLTTVDAGTLNLETGLTGDLLFSGDGTVNLADGQTMSGNVTTVGDPLGPIGVLNFAGTGTVMGNVGEANELDGDGNPVSFNGIYAVNADGIGLVAEDQGLDIAGDLYAGTLNFGSDGEVRVGGDAGLSSVTTSLDNAGILTLAGNADISDEVGGMGSALKLIALTGGAETTVTMNNSVYAYDIELGAGTLVLNGSFYDPGAIMTLTFTDDGEVVLGDEQGIDHSIITTNDGEGTLTFLGNGEVTGQVGTGVDGETPAKFLKAINVTNNGGSVNLGTAEGGAVYVNRLNFLGSDWYSDITFYGDAHIGQGAENDGITTEGDGYSSINFEGDVVLDGDVGSAEKAVGEIHLYGEGATLYLGGHVYASEEVVPAIYLDNYYQTTEVAAGKNIDATIDAYGEDSTLTFLGSTTVSQPIGWYGDYPLGAVNFNGGTVALNNAIWAEDVFVNNDTALSVATSLFADNSGEIDGSLTLQGTSSLDLGVNALHINALYAQGAGTTLKLTITDPVTYGYITCATATVSEASTVYLTVEEGSGITADQTFTIVDPGFDPLDNPEIASLSVIDNTTDWRFVPSILGGDLVLTVESQAGETYVPATDPTPNGTSVGEALDSIEDPGSDMSTVMGELDALRDDPEAYNSALDDLDPDASTGVPAGMFNMMNQVGSLYALRMDGLRSGINTGETGFAFGDQERPRTFWMKGLANYMNQDLRKGFEGYNATTAGTLMGIDWMATDDLRVGWGGGWARTDINNDGNAGGTDVDSYLGSLYGGYHRADAGWYLDGVLSAGFNQYDGKRQIVFGGIQRVARSDYAGRQYTALLSGGYDIALKGGAILTPLASLQYAHLDLDKYQETGADAINLSVSRQRYDLLQSGLGFKLARPVSLSSGTLIPEAHVKWLCEYLHDKAQMTSTFTGGGASFSTTGASPARHSYNMGLGLTLVSEGDWSLLANYDVELKDEFYSHAGSMTVRIAF